MTAVATALVNSTEFANWLIPGGEILGTIPFDAVVSVAMGGVLQLWSECSEYGEQVGDDAVLRFVQTPLQVEHIAGVPGIVAALEGVGWLAWDADGHAVLPGFMKHNTMKPKQGGSADRVRRWREKKGCNGQGVTSSVTSGVTCNAPRALHTPLHAPLHGVTKAPLSVSVSESVVNSTKGGVGGNDARDPDAREADAFFGAGPPANATDAAVQRWAEAVGGVGLAAMKRALGDADEWAQPDLYGLEVTLAAIQWGTEQRKPWAQVRSRVRNASEKAGWVPNVKGPVKKTEDERRREIVEALKGVDDA